MAGAAPLLTVDEPDETVLAEESRPFWRRPRLLWVVVLVGIVVFVAIWRFSDGGPAPLTQNDVDRAVRSGIEKAQTQARNSPPDAATAYRRILPSLVTVVSSAAPATPAAGARVGAAKSSLGAGVIINAEGAVLTALHVVENDGKAGGKIQVRFADGTLANAMVERRQPENDIAVLTVDQLPEVTVPAVIGGGAQVGDAVFPVGNPLGLQGSLSAGVVSALDRSVRSENGQTLKQLIQFDAAVNPGNSGGPLLDRDGHVIGIVTALANPSQQPYFVGIGFAVPIATAGGAAGGPSK
jgi:S1-C subfamily serine protease